MPTTSKVNFTVSRVNEFKCERGKKQSFLWDLGCPGLGLRVTGGGSRSFIFQSKLNGKTIRVTIGDVTGWPLPKAREKGRKLQRLFDEGIDPRKEKAERKAALEREQMTVEKAWEKYLAAKKGHWSDRHMRDHEYLSKKPEDGKVTGVLWPLLQKQMSDIDVDCVKRWAENARDEFAKRQAEAEVSKKGTNIRGRNNALIQGFIRFRAFWKWCAERPELFGVLTDPNALFTNSDVKSLIPKAGVKSDSLEKTQLKAWFDAVRSIQNPTVSAYIQILLLTGTRRRELSRLRWGDIDFQWKVFWVHDKIEEEGRKVPLTPYVEHLLSTLPRKNEWVFAAKRADSGHIEEPLVIYKRALSIMELPVISLHGLRRSFSTLSEWVEAPQGVIAQIQGHKPSATIERHYRVRPLDLLAMWHKKFEVWILEQADIRFNAQAAETGLHAVGNDTE